MRTPEIALAQKTSALEEEKGGKTMMPPQFKLSAGAEDGNLGAEQGFSALDSALDAAGTGGYTERVSNFATLTDRILNATNPQKLVLALESLKRDAKELQQFKSYFATKAGISFDDHIISNFGEESFQAIMSNMTANVKELPLDAVAKLFKDCIDNGDEAGLMSYLLIFDKGSQATAVFSKAYPGLDLKTELLGIANEGSDLFEMIQNLWGDRQNYEKVKVNNEAEASEARAIIARIFDNYGIDVNSQKMLEVVKTSYPDAPEDLKRKVHTETWQLSDLKDLEFSLSNFAPIAGENRKNSTRSNEAQPITTVGRVNKSIRYNNDEKKHTLSAANGAYFNGSNAVGVFDGAEDGKESGKTKGSGELVNDSMRMVMTHELGHGFLEYAVDDFKNEMAFWNATPEERRGKWNTVTLPNGERHTIWELPTKIEVPPTTYGTKSHKEDLADSIALYFNNRSSLSNGAADFQKVRGFHNFKNTTMAGAPCPQRLAFIHRKIAEWKRR